MFMDEDDKLVDVARRESNYLHDHGLFDASIALDELLLQRSQLLEALKDMCVLYNTDEGTRSLPQYVAAVRAIRRAESK